MKKIIMTENFGKNINRKTNTSFFIVKTDENIDLSNRQLTESEKKAGFEIFFESIPRLKHLIETNPTTNPKRASFDREILAALSEYGNFIKGNNAMTIDD